MRAGTGGVWVNNVQVFDANANLLKPPTYACAANQVMVGADAQGVAICRTVECAPGNAFRGFAANGSPVCEADNVGITAIPANNCPDGQALVSINAAGVTACRAVHDGDRSCPAGQFVKRIFADGSIDCTTPDASAAVPAGAIMAFNAAACPAGWSPADGGGGRPNLRGRFPIGTGGDGGANSPSIGLRGLGGAGQHRIWVRDNEFPCCAGDRGVVGVAMELSDGAWTERHGDNDSWSWRAGGWTWRLPPYTGVLWCVKN